MHATPMAGLVAPLITQAPSPRLELAAPDARDAVPRMPESARSYEVRVRRSIGSVCLIGHDGRGEPMMEVRIARRCMSPSIVRRIEDWCRENDDALPSLALHGTPPHQSSSAAP